MRYCALIGSMRSWTPRFSTQKSPSSIFSSKVKPYWKPEQPPPETNTRSFRFGLASSRISSLTLPAAASVKTSTSGGGGGEAPAAAEEESALAVFMCIVYPPPSLNQSKRLRFETRVRSARPPAPVRGKQRSGGSISH